MLLGRALWVAGETASQAQSPDAVYVFNSSETGYPWDGSALSLKEQPALDYCCH